MTRRRRGRRRRRRNVNNNSSDGGRSTNSSSSRLKKITADKMTSVKSLFSYLIWKSFSTRLRTKY